MAPAFAYEAVDTAGRRHRGRKEAPDLRSLGRLLEGQGLLVLQMEEAPARGSRRSALPFGRNRQLLEASRALASLLKAGLPLAQALDATAGITRGPLSAVLAEVQSRIERGEAVAATLARHPSWFSAHYRGLVRVGEKRGELTEAFAALTMHLERQEELRARLISASIYPLILGLVGGGAMLVLLLLVVPRFAALLADTGATLPRSTALMLGASTAVRKLWPLFIAGGVCGMGGLCLVAKSEGGRERATRFFLRLPILGAAVRSVLAAQFARVTGSLLAGGAPLLGALDGMAESAWNPVVRAEASRIRKRVREGRTLHSAIVEGDLFPDLLARLVSVGDESGRLDDFLLEAAVLFEKATERAAQRLVALAEPVLILVFGMVVGLVAFSLLEAVYGLNAGAFR